jgi:hypothetical protein
VADQVKPAASKHISKDKGIKLPRQLDNGRPSIARLKRDGIGGIALLLQQQLPRAHGPLRVKDAVN